MAVKKMHVNKRAMSLKFFVELILFVFIFFMAYYLFLALQGFLLKDLGQGTIKTMEGLKVDIDNMISNETKVIMYVDEEFKIVGFNKNDLPSKCKGDRSCICVCNKESDCEHNAIKECLSVTKDIEKKFTCFPKIGPEDNKPRIYEAAITEKEGKVNVLC